ncbi:MAG: hypothetical protein M1355_02685 [Patescibacteria group bacterium]|nr:hypothetical protein [Patescibacteria group bacterium]
MTTEEKAERIADLLLRVEMPEEEMKNWLQVIPKMNKDQLNEFIDVFETELRELELLRADTRDKLKGQILELIKNNA